MPIEGDFLSDKSNFAIILHSSFDFDFSDSFPYKFSLFLSLFKVCTVFFASLYSISSTLDLYYLKILNNFFLTASFSTIPPSDQSFLLFFTLIVFVRATLFTTLKKI